MLRTAIEIDAERRARERGEIAVVLLLVQSVFGLLTLLGTVAAAAFLPVLSPAGLLVVVGFLVPLLSAIGVARGWRWARRLAQIFQGFVLFSLWVNLLLDLLPPIQAELTLTGLVTGALLPVAILVVVRTSTPQASAERQALPKPSPPLQACAPESTESPPRRSLEPQHSALSAQYSALAPEVR